MKRKIAFHNMEHSTPMEELANEKINKLEEFLQDPSWATPKYVELWLKSNAQHPHHAAELHLKTPQFDLHTHDEGTQMYIVMDSVIDKMIKLVKKEKEKFKDKKKNSDSDKKIFVDDKYNL